MLRIQHLRRGNDNVCHAPLESLNINCVCILPYFMYYDFGYREIWHMLQ
mgnify:CR=1 FL=1|jgi:hypothetical protein